MPETFKALVINQDGENFSREVKELNFDFLKMFLDSYDVNEFCAKSENSFTAILQYFRKNQNVISISLLV